MSRLVIISNRLPITVNRRDGELHYHPSAGGLATGLNSLDDSFERLWIGWPGQNIENEWEKASIREDLAKDGLVPVFLTDDDIELYYEGFSNKTIWPHFHYFTQHTTYEDEYWESYESVNRRFFEIVKDQLQEDDMVWVHDYQLMLLPNMIREAFPKVSIGFFLHIPFPSYEVFRMLPWRQQILDGILGSDLIGFHTFDYMRHFLSATYRICGHEHEFGHLTVGKRIVNVDVFPMGIDYEKYAFPDVNQDDPGAVEIRELAKNRKIIMSVDRLDYTKGIPQRIKAFKQFITEHPEYRRKVTLVMIVVPSRAGVDTYSRLKQEVDELVGSVNSAHSTFDWVPIQYYYRSLNFAELTTLYKVSDIALITPLRDGMNLVAKEYVAAKEESKDGVIILSEMAGAAQELNDAITVNPQDANDIVAALVEALEQSPEDRRRHMEIMQAKLKQYNVRAWAATFIQEQKRLMDANRAKQTKRLGEKGIRKIAETYRQAKERLLILDYDGTLMGFKVDPQAVAPDEEVLDILESLARQEHTHVVVNSGRDRTTLERWIGHLPLELSAEHGVWMKLKGEWQLNPNVTDHWKGEVMQLLQNLVERTPGSHIEEKDYSLAWHYRGIDRDFGQKRVREFRDMLAYLIQNQDLQILEGNKVVEIKNSGINKGKSTQNWVSRRSWDFILGMGDDTTDEDIFRVLPDSAFSIKVGLDRTVARYSLTGVPEVRELLKEMTKEES